jgi:hypothetical protein
VNLAGDLVEALEEAAKTTGSDYQNLVPLALILQGAEIDTLEQLQRVIVLAKRPDHPPTWLDQVLKFLMEKL